MEKNECKRYCHKKYKWHFKVRKIVDEQIDTYFEIENSNFKLKEHGYKVGDKVLLNKDKYLHGLGKSEDAIEFVSKQGIVSKDAATGKLTRHAFQFVSGFWRVKEDISLKDYIINYSGMDVRYEDKWCLVPYNGLDEFVERMKDEDHFKWEAESSMEIRFMPSLARDINQYGFILDISSDEAKKLVKNDVNGRDFDKNIATYFGMFKPSEKEKIKKCTFAHRASYVIFGMNKCFIEGIIVGRRVEKDKESLKNLKDKFPTCYICNLDGEVILA